MPFMSLDVLRISYFSYVHSVITYGIHPIVKKYLKFRKKIIKIVMNSRMPLVGNYSRK